MSCHRITMKGGHKVCLPVLNREEYLRLRGSRAQGILVSAIHRGAPDKKTQLLQMNYSCIPGEDGRLAGCKTPSNSVGMDIDHIPPEEMQEVRDRILQKKDELGLLMLERSAREEGYHLVFRRHPELSQEENLRWAAGLLEVAYDEGAKDITRVFFTTTDSPEDLIYLDDELFRPTPCPSLNGGENKTIEPTKPVEESSPLPSREGSEVGLYHGLPYSRIVEAWLGREKVEPGDRHHTSLILADQLRYITDNDPVLIERILRQTPFVQEIVRERNENVKNTVESAQKFEFLKGMPKKMADAIERAKLLPSDSESEASVFDDLTQGWNPPQLPSKLPRQIHLLLKPFPKEYHPVLAPSVSVVLAPHASHFRTTYIDGRVIGPGLYAGIAAPSGSNKSFVTNLMDEMTKDTLQEWDKNEWAKVRENQELRERMANAKEKPIRYRPKLRIAETMSKTSLLELQTNLGDNGMLLCSWSEADALVNATKTQFSDISVLLRKAWDGDVVRQYYMSENSCNTQTRVNASILLTGTPKAVLTRLFSDTEDGMMQRFMPLLMPPMKRTFLPPRITPLTKDEQLERDGLLMSLWQKDLALGDETCLLEMPKTQKVVREWYNALEEKYNDGLLTEAEANLSHRIGQFMMRAAIPFVALTGEENRDMLEYIKWLGDYVYYNICYIFSSRVAQDMMESEKLLSKHMDKRITAEPLLNLMPETFTIPMFQEVRLSHGQSGEVRTLLSRYVKKGKLKRLENGVFRKIEANSNASEMVCSGK